MNKKDIIIAIILVAMIPLVLLIDSRFIAPKISKPVPVQEQQLAEDSTQDIKTTETVTTTLSQAVDEKAEEVLPEPAEEEVLATLRNDHVILTLSSHGASVKSVELIGFPEVNKDESPNVVLDFSDAPALAYEGLKGLDAKSSFTVNTADDQKSVSFTKALPSGLVFQRTISFTNEYMLNIADSFINNSDAAKSLPQLALPTGYMRNPKEMKQQRGMIVLGADAYTKSRNIYYGGKYLNKLYKNAGKPTSLAVTPEDLQEQMVEWVSAKNKFFVQIIRPTNPIATMEIRSNAERDGKNVLPTNIAAVLQLPKNIVEPKNNLNLSYNYFIGPKKYSLIKQHDPYFEGVMEFRVIGFWKGWSFLMEPARRGLLWTLNMFYGFIHSYGLSIILLTILVKILFWPLTHKSTESMRRMQELQPQIKAIQEKYKKDPQQMQAETMKFYKENKVNPMSGCLPMIVQMPVLFALFTVLRNAIELRYAGFLWIRDLSAPESLFAGSFPVVGELNILPLLMSGTMFWQQKLTPQSATTPEQQQQQKMMMYMMPIMMLVFFYKMPSGLVLYWTTSQIIMIIQMSIRNMKKKAKEA